MHAASECPTLRAPAKDDSGLRPLTSRATYRPESRISRQVSAGDTVEFSHSPSQGPKVSCVGRVLQSTSRAVRVRFTDVQLDGAEQTAAFLALLEEFADQVA